MQIQYLGFQLKEKGRDYRYIVIDPKTDPREFTFSITLRALGEGRVRYQDAASMCYQKLQRALEQETEESPLPRRSTVSDQELSAFQESRVPDKKKRRGHFLPQKSRP